MAVPGFLSNVDSREVRGPWRHVSFDYPRLSLGPVQRVLARANAVAVLETSDCRGRKFFRGRPPRVMHIHEYSNVIERRARAGVEGDGRGPRALRSAVDSIQEWRGPTTRAYTDKSGSRTAAPPGEPLVVEYRGTAVHFMRIPRRDDTHDTDSYLAKDTARVTQKSKRYERDAMTVFPKRLTVSWRDRVLDSFDTDIERVPSLRWGISMSARPSSIDVKTLRKAGYRRYIHLNYREMLIRVHKRAGESSFFVAK